MAAEDDLRLAWLAAREGRLGMRDALLTLAVASSGPADKGWAARGWRRLIEIRADHLFAGFSTRGQALADDRVAAALTRLRATFPTARVQRLLLRADVLRGTYTGRPIALPVILEEILGPPRPPVARRPEPVAPPIQPEPQPAPVPLAFGGLSFIDTPATFEAEASPPGPALFEPADPGATLLPTSGLLFECEAPAPPPRRRAIPAPVEDHRSVPDPDGDLDTFYLTVLLAVAMLLSRTLTESDRESRAA